MKPFGRSLVGYCGNAVHSVAGWHNRLQTVSSLFLASSSVVLSDVLKLAGRLSASSACTPDSGPYPRWTLRSDQSAALLPRVLHCTSHKSTSPKEWGKVPGPSSVNWRMTRFPQSQTHRTWRNRRSWP